MRRIQKWMASHPNAKFLDPRRLARELKSEDPLELAAGLAFLVNKGVLKPGVHVLDPNHRVFSIDGPFGAHERLPAELRDQRHDTFAAEKGERVVVYIPARKAEVGG